jgi:hypothetical protein
MRRKINFKVESYKVATNGDLGQLIIGGYKMPPPSKRITLHQKNIKVLDAKIVFKHKKVDVEVEVARINHLKSFGEIRIHANSVLYPGSYIITLEYKGQLDEKQLQAPD